MSYAVVNDFNEVMAKTAKGFMEVARNHSGHIDTVVNSGFLNLVYPLLEKEDLRFLMNKVGYRAASHDLYRKENEKLQIAESVAKEMAGRISLGGLFGSSFDEIIELGKFFNNENMWWAIIGRFEDKITEEQKETLREYSRNSSNNPYKLY